MRWFISGVVTALILALGCVTTSHDVLPPDAQTLPPAFQVQSNADRQSLDYFLLKMGDASRERRVQWWVEFRRANLWRDTDSKISCEKFAALSHEEKFPLKDLALVRAHHACATITPAPQLAPLESVPVKSWLAQPRLEAAWAIAQAKQDHALEFDLLIEKSKISAVPEEKLALAQAALKVAENLKDAARLEIARSRQEKIAPRFLRKAQSSDWLSMAQDFRRARDFEQARAYYERILKQKKIPFATRLSALKGLAQTLKTERKKAEYLVTLEKIMNLTFPGKKSRNQAALRQHLDASTFYARALWTESNVSKARGLLEEKAAFLEKKYPRGEIFWLLGRMSEEARDYTKAVEWFKRASLEIRPRSELQEKVMWGLAWNLRKLERFAEAVEAITKGRDDTANEFSRVRLQYWLARTQTDAKFAPEVIKASYEELIKNDPLGYYGLLAHHDLKTTVHRPPAPAAPKTPSRLKEVIDHPVFEWLVAVEEFDLARLILDTGAESIRQSGKGGLADEVTWSDLLKAYARTGHFQQLYERLGRLPAEQRQQILAQHPDLLFPQPFRETVFAAAEQQSIPAELLFAIMRQESSFNPRARSPADAFGLMQLLPEVALDAAPAVKVNYQKAEDLYNPLVNIPVGAYHIRQLWNRFNGQFILAVASYNASEKVIKTWMRVRYHGDSTAFIEDIPYEETRGYIRLVMRNMIFYQLMNNPAGKIEFPAWVLDLKDPRGSD